MSLSCSLVLHQGQHTLEPNMAAQFPDAHFQNGLLNDSGEHTVNKRGVFVCVFLLRRWWKHTIYFSFLDAKVSFSWALLCFSNSTLSGLQRFNPLPQEILLSLYHKSASFFPCCNTELSHQTDQQILQSEIIPPFAIEAIHQHIILKEKALTNFLSNACTPEVFVSKT